MSIRSVKILYHVYATHTAVSISAQRHEGADKLVHRLGSIDLPMGTETLPGPDLAELARMLILQLASELR